MYSLGRGSEAILLALNENNVLNVDRPFNVDSIRRVIENRKYLGEYKFKGQSLEMVFQQL